MCDVSEVPTRMIEGVQGRFSLRFHALAIRSRSLAVTGLAAMAATGALLSVSADRVAVASEARAASAHCSGIHWRTLHDGTQTCPSQHNLNSGKILGRLSWSSWGGSTAEAKGYLARTIFQRKLPHRVYELQPATVRLSRAYTCGHVRIYSYFEMTVYSKRGHHQVEHAAYPISCNGKTGGGNA
jgi:hypothetical protein